MKSGLAQYNGLLNSAQIAAGMNCATKNAVRLLEDARLMLERSRFPSAVALAILSIEESGKHTILRELALARSQDEARSIWREYRQHTSKNRLWILMDSVLKGASKLRDFRHLFDPDAEHPKLLDNVKQASFYTDCLGRAHWSFPEEVVGRELAEMLVTVAEVLSHSREITPEEVDLWIFHMQPVFKTTAEAMERGLAAWDAEMRSRGLCAQDGPTMKDFIDRGFPIRKKR